MMEPVVGATSTPRPGNDRFFVRVAARMAAGWHSDGRVRPVWGLGIVAPPAFLAFAPGLPQPGGLTGPPQPLRSTAKGFDAARAASSLITPGAGAVERG